MAFANTAREFINSSFRTLPNVPMPFWPFETLGVSARYRGTEQLKLSAGVYDQGKDAHQWWTTQTSRGWFFLGQADLQLFPDAEKSARTLLRGGWWSTTSDTFAAQPNCRTFAQVNCLTTWKEEEASFGITIGHESEFRFFFSK